MTAPPRCNVPGRQRRELLQRLALLAAMPTWRGPAAAAEGNALGDKPFGEVLGRVRADFLAEGGPGEARQFTASIGANGTWDDVDYADRGIGDWRPMQHLVRLRRIARALAEPGQKLLAAEAGRSALNRGLQAWLQRKPVSDNWWHNTIGQQRELARVLVLCRPLLDAGTATQAIKLLQDPGMVPPAQATGQNLTWYATQQLLRGALREDALDLARASAALAATLRITLDEGIQPDFSFHQHGAQFYTGGYGLGFLQDNVQIAAWLAGTPWAMPAAGLDVLANYALQGMAPLLRGKLWLDWSARGREFTRDETMPRPALVAGSLARLAPLVPARSADMNAASAQIRAGGAPAGATNRCFWRSDFMVHQTPTAYMSVKLCSARTVGTESGNGENLQGFWLPFGVTYLLRRGDEYDGLPPVWDWSALPGLTAPATVPNFNGYQTHQSQFVGGLSDGEAGLATMALDKLQTAARLSWFFMGDTMVAMGAGIRSTQDQPVFTTLNQCRWNGAVYTDAGVLQDSADRLRLDGKRWVWHDGLTYRLLDGPDLWVSREHRTRRNNTINTALGAAKSDAKVLTVAMQHGVRPSEARFAYAVSAHASRPTDAGVDLKIEMLANTEALQAVRWSATGQTMAVLHAPGSVPVGDGLSLEIDARCLVIVTATGSSWEIRVADPTRRTTPMRVSLRNRANAVKSTTVRFDDKQAVSYWATWVVRL
ncbi:MAG: hypothetical protein K2Q07_00315 [Burkholderiaceae bacterium]|nr:hypothetical protein [Burkholderiaceae bacterium]